MHDLIQFPVSKSVSPNFDHISVAKHIPTTQSKPSENHAWRVPVFNDYLSTKADYLANIESLYYSEANVY